MAYSAALRRIEGAASGLLSRASNPVRLASFAPAVVRSFNTNAEMKRFDDDYDRLVDVDRWTSGSFAADVSDTLLPTPHRLSQTDGFTQNYFMPARAMGGGGGTRRSWDVKEDDDALFLRMDMPGLGKEDVKLLLEQNTLTIKEESESVSEWYKEDCPRKFDLTPSLFKLREIKAEMKNGVLKILVPKLKEDDKKDVHEIKIE